MVAFFGARQEETHAHTHTHTATSTATTTTTRTAPTHNTQHIEKEKMEEKHQRKVEKMIKSAEGSAGLLHKITKPTMWRGGVQILKEEEDASFLDRCQAKKKEWAKHWQCDEEIQNVQNKAMEK